MFIVLDANVIRKDFMLKTDDFANLFDYLVKTQSKILMPQIVFEEIQNLYRNELIGRQESYIKFFKSLNLLLTESFEPQNELSVEEETRKYMDYLKVTLDLNEKDIVPYKESYLKEVVKRAVNRIKPCSSKGEEFRDTLLWLTVLDIAKEKEDKKVALISHNKKDFAHEDDGNKLHPQLKQDMEKIGVEVWYYSSLSQFIQKHATKIKFIDEEWIKQHIDIHEVNERFLNVLNDFEQEELFHRAKDNYKQCTGYICACGGGLGIDDFFVYEKTDGSMYLEVNLSGEIEVEVEFEEEVKTERERYEYDYVYNPRTGYTDLEVVPKFKFTAETECKYGYIYPEYEVKLSVVIKDKKIEKYTIKEFGYL
ncbi:PIN domain-containing protein [Bacillus thuringiensis]|uniref:PIN domain-containing protein n=1 Tax=Bacillus thuringiensis TaxID=1428 RepID=UPI001CD325B8|nr:PIN domain-containing protein [Bacillus thuringiensis]MCA1001010.1 PIN domain-containing protein [Bacillus thuringiensis]